MKDYWSRTITLPNAKRGMLYCYIKDCSSNSFSKRAVKSARNLLCLLISFCSSIYKVGYTSIVCNVYVLSLGRKDTPYWS